MKSKHHLVIINKSRSGQGYARAAIRAAYEQYKYMYVRVSSSFCSRCNLIHIPGQRSKCLPAYCYQNTFLAFIYSHFPFDAVHLTLAREFHCTQQWSHEPNSTRRHSTVHIRNWELIYRLGLLESRVRFGVTFVFW